MSKKSVITSLTYQRCGWYRRIRQAGFKIYGFLPITIMIGAFGLGLPPINAEILAPPPTDIGTRGSNGLGTPTAIRASTRVSIVSFGVIAMALLSHSDPDIFFPVYVIGGGAGGLLYAIFILRRRR